MVYRLQNTNLIASQSSKASSNPAACIVKYVLDGVVNQGTVNSELFTFCAEPSDASPWIHIDMQTSFQVYMVTQKIVFKESLMKLT